jgi:hypothetical protein
VELGVACLTNTPNNPLEELLEILMIKERKFPKEIQAWFQ